MSPGRLHTPSKMASKAVAGILGASLGMFAPGFEAAF